MKSTTTTHGQQWICFHVIFHSRKYAKSLGETWKKGIPIEVLPVAYKVTKKEIERQLGGEAIVREGTEKIVGALALANVHLTESKLCRVPYSPIKGTSFSIGNSHRRQMPIGRASIVR